MSIRASLPKAAEIDLPRLEKRCVRPRTLFSIA